MTLGARLLKSFGSALFGKAFTVLCGVATFAILARHLGAEGLGDYRIVLTLLAFAGMTFDFGLQKITLREISGPDADQGQIVGAAVALRIVATSAAVVTLAVIVWFSPYDEEVLTGVLIAGVGWVAYQISELLLAVFQRRLAQHRSALAESVGAITTLSVVSILSVGDAGTTAMLGATATGWMVAMLLSWTFAFRLNPFRPRIDLVLWRSLLIAGLPIAASGLLLIAHLRADVLLLSLLGESSDVGIYDVSLRLYELITSIPHLTGGLLLPLFVADRIAGRTEFTRRLRASLSVALLASTLVMTIVMVHAESIATLLAGAGFGTSGPIMRVMFVSVVFATLSSLLRFAALAYDLQRVLLRADLLAVSVAVVAYVLLIPRFGPLGAAVGKLIGDVGILLLMVLLLGTQLRFSAPRGIAVTIGSAFILWVLLEVAERMGVHWLVATTLGGSLVGAAVLALPTVRQEFTALVHPTQSLQTADQPTRNP